LRDAGERQGGTDNREKFNSLDPDRLQLYGYLFRYDGISASRS